MVLTTWLCDFCGTPKDSAFSRQAAERVRASTTAPHGAGCAQMGRRPMSPRLFQHHPGMHLLS